MKHALSPLTIILILGYFLVVGVVGLWADNQETQIAGPAIVKQSENGDILVQVGDTLFKVTKQSKDLKQYDLTQLGVGRLFDYVLLDNNEILVRLGPYSKGLFHNIEDFLRLPNRREVKAPSDGNGIYQCNLETNQCRRYSEDYDPDDVHWFAYDPKTKELFVADVTRHKIHKLNAKGNKIATQGDEYFFPNHMLLEGQDLYLVDTNHKRIKSIRKTDAGFGQMIKQYDPVSGKSTKAGHRFPYMMLATETEFWVLILNNAMKHGGLYRFNKDFSYIDHVELLPDTDAGYISVIDKQVWVSDYVGNRILVYAMNGQFVQEFTTPALEAIFKQNLADRAYYGWLARGALWVFVISIVLGAVIGVFQQLDASVFKRQSSEADIAVKLDDPDIIWLGRNKSMSQIAVLVFLVMAVVLILSLVLISFDTETEHKAVLLPLLVVVVFIVIAAIVMYRMFYLAAIGVYKDVLILKCGRKHRTARGKNIYYSGGQIAIGDIVVQLQAGVMQYFALEDIVKHLNPIIKDATILTHQQMGLYQFKQTSRWVWVLVVAIVSITLIFFSI